MSSTAATGITGMTDIAAIEAVPLSDRRLPATTYEMLAAGAAISPGAPALSFFLRSRDFARPTVWTHAELFAEITRTANALRARGVGREDVVAFALPNLPETHFVIWGAEAAGIAFAINPLLETDQIARLLRASGASHLITLGPNPGSDIWERVSAAARDVPGLRSILTVSVAPYLGPTARVVLRTREVLQRRSAGSVPVEDFRCAIAGARDDALTFDLPGRDDISSYFCTGGTTGLPKIARRTHGSEVFDSWAMQTFVPGAFAPHHAVFCGLPLFHVNAQLVTGLAPWSQGAHVVLGTPQGYRGEGVLPSFWDIAEHYRVIAFSGVPTIYSSLLDHPVGVSDISSIRYGLCGAAPLSEHVFRRFESTTGIRILEAYGLTEGACVSSVNPPTAAARIGSIGLRLPYQHMRAAVLGTDGGFDRWARTDEVGALLLSGPNVFAGYADPRHDEGVWFDADGRQWFNTGDLARQDEDGCFWLTGRAKDLIIRGGHNIDPQIIEEVLHAHPAVAAAAAIGRPDTHAGEVPVVYVQLSQDAEAAESDLLEFARAKVPERAARPRAVHIIEQMPTTAVGKIFKPALIMAEIESVIAEAARRVEVTLSCVTVHQDETRGLMAEITVAGQPGDLSGALAGYGFAFEVRTTPSS
ncbi:acyl-CoA synthetase [Brevibacterium sp. 2SA]|uniref:acyl-CoA synthetase n=1 Tax=Brevibacterium sp. 2SA TaxID=2502198 RepID=UPI0010F88DC2|nr:acyl-CoA synthetase [Brevibacterium sp. 2SA]